MTTMKEDHPAPGARTGLPGVQQRQIGIALVALAGVFWSLQGPIVRVIETASGPQIVFWRAVGQLVVMLGVVAIVNRGRVVSAFRLAGYRAVVGALCHAASSTCFVLAVLHTTVANVVFIMASAPLLAAVVAWRLLRERIETRTLGAMIVAVIGIAVMMSEGLATGDVTGTLLALVTTFGFAGIAVIARWCGGLTLFLYGAKFVPAGVLAFLTLTRWFSPRSGSGPPSPPSAYTLAGGAVVLNMLPAVCLGAALTVVAGWMMAGGDDGGDDLPDLQLCGGAVCSLRRPADRDPVRPSFLVYGAKFGHSGRRGDSPGPHADRGAGSRPCGRSASSWNWDVVERVFWPSEVRRACAARYTLAGRRAVVLVAICTEAVPAASATSIAPDRRAPRTFTIGCADSRCSVARRRR